MVTSHDVCFPFRLRFPAAFCGVSASGFGRPPQIWEIPGQRGQVLARSSRMIWNFGWFLIRSIYIYILHIYIYITYIYICIHIYGPPIWEYNICFVPNIPLGELAKNRKNLTCLASEKTWKRAHLFGHPGTMELEILEIPSLQVYGTSPRTSGSKETKTLEPWDPTWCDQVAQLTHEKPLLKKHPGYSFCHTPAANNLLHAFEILQILLNFSMRLGLTQASLLKTGFRSQLFSKGG